MRTAVDLITAPTIEPVTYGEVIDHLRINSFDEEIDEASVAYIDTLITAVREDAETFTDRKFITQTWKYYLDEWPDEDYIEVPFNPLQSITSVVVLSSDSIPSPITASSYLADTKSLKGRLVLAYGESWPTQTLYPMNPIQIEFVCGYGDLAEDVPARIKQAILIQIADLYENRQTIIEGKQIQRLETYERLLYPFKVKWV